MDGKSSGKFLRKRKKKVGYLKLLLDERMLLQNKNVYKLTPASKILLLQITKAPLT